MPTNIYNVSMDYITSNCNWVVDSSDVAELNKIMFELDKLKIIINKKNLKTE